MTFYKLTFSIFLLIFVACSSNIETNNSEETNTFVQVSTTTTVMEADEGIDWGQAFSNFENYWKPLLKENRPLTDEELNITYALRELMDQEFDYFEGKGGYFYLEDFICNEKVRGMSPGGYIDEIHPVQLIDTDAYNPDSFWGYCDSASSDEWKSTFGIPFFQAGIWWTFVNTNIYDTAITDCKKIFEICDSQWVLATRVKIEIPEDFLAQLDIPEVENVVQDIQDTSARDYRYNRGVLRYAPWQSIPLVSKATHAYEEKTIDPDHDYIDYFIYSVDFPQFNEDIACSKEINTAITNTMNSFISDKKSILENYTPKDAEEDGYEFWEQLLVYYDIVEVSDFVVSVIITNQSYSFGAAHPVSYPVSLNFDLRYCSEISINKLFDVNSGYEDVLLHEMQLQVCSPLYEDLCNQYFEKEPKSLIDLEKCCSVVAISQYGLFINFWEYEVSGYAQGAELILIPWAGIASNLDKDGPYADILREYSQMSWLVTPYEPEWDF